MVQLSLLYIAPPPLFAELPIKSPFSESSVAALFTAPPLLPDELPIYSTLSVFTAPPDFVTVSFLFVNVYVFCCLRKDLFCLSVYFVLNKRDACV